MAQAARNCGGIVIAPADQHWQTGSEVYNPAYCGEVRVPLAAVAPVPLDERKVIARRAATGRGS